MLFIWIFKKNVVILRRLMINTMMKHFFSFLLLLCGICSVYAELTPYKEGKLVGLKDDDGNVVVAPKYTAIGDYSGTYTWMNVGGKGGYEHCPLGGKWGVLNELGEEVCPAEYDYVDLCNDHYVNVNKGGVMTIDNRTFTGGLWGIYDLVAKKEVVPCQYTQLGPVNQHGICWAQKDGKIARRLIADLVKDKKSKITDAKLCFYTQSDFEMKEMLLRHRDDGLWGVIDITGKELTEFSYTKVFEFVFGYSIVYERRKAGLVTEKGLQVVPCQFFEITNPGPTSVYWGMKDKLYALYNLNGQQLTPEKYQEALPFTEGVAWAKQDSLFALVDTLGVERILPTFGKVNPFFNGLATVATEHVGIVNTLGQVVIPLEYQDAPELFGDNQFRPVDKHSADCIGYVKDYDGACVWFDSKGTKLERNGKELYGVTDTIPNALWNY